MCGRFFVPEEISGDEFLEAMLEEATARLTAMTGEKQVARGEVLPSATVAALARGRNGSVGAYPMRWGFRRHDGKGLIINTRSETALQKPMFRPSMMERRCLIPADRYFEWEKRGKEKTKYAIRPKRSGMIYLAGIYRFEEDQKLPVLSILTREPAPEIAFIHDRMPVIFTGGNHGEWLSRGADPEELLRLCEQEMEFCMV